MRSVWDNFCVISVLMPPQFIHERDCCHRQHPLKICWNYCISEHCLAEHLTNHMWTLQWAEQFCQQLPGRKIGQGVSSSMGTKKAATWSSVLQKITTKKLENIKLFEFSVTVFHLVVGFLVWSFFFFFYSALTGFGVNKKDKQFSIWLLCISLLIWNVILGRTTVPVILWSLLAFLSPNKLKQMLDKTMRFRNRPEFS